jgi:hypothetical protein
MHAAEYRDAYPDVPLEAMYPAFWSVSRHHTPDGSNTFTQFMRNIREDGIGETAARLGWPLRRVVDSLLAAREHYATYKGGEYGYKRAEIDELLGIMKNRREI